MALRWEHSRVAWPDGTYHVQHWARHDPNALLDVLSGEPIEIIGNHPAVEHFRFGRHDLAVRSYAQTDRSCSTPIYHMDPEELIAALTKLVDRRAAVLEMPVAFIKHPGGKRLRIVSLWHKKTRGLDEFLTDPAVPDASKRRACLSAVRKTAILNRAGYWHSHPRSDNFVVDASGRVQLIDFNLVRPLQENAADRDIALASHSLASAYFAREASQAARIPAALSGIKLVRHLERNHPNLWNSYEPERTAFQDSLRRAYDAEFHRGSQSA